MFLDARMLWVVGGEIKRAGNGSTSVGNCGLELITNVIHLSISSNYTRQNHQLQPSTLATQMKSLAPSLNANTCISPRSSTHSSKTTKPLTLITHSFTTSPTTLPTIPLLFKSSLICWTLTPMN